MDTHDRYTYLTFSTYCLSAHRLPARLMAKRLPLAESAGANIRASTCMPAGVQRLHVLTQAHPMMPRIALVIQVRTCTCVVSCMML